MSRAKRQSFDVFLAHDEADNALAGAVIDRLTTAGLTVFSLHLTDERPLDPSSETVRRELQDSFTFVVLLTPAFARSETLPFLIGAAVMAKSPVHVLTSDEHSLDGMTYLDRFPVAPLWDGVERLVRQIRDASAPFEAEQTWSLREAYLQVGATTDDILVRPSYRANLIRTFRTLSGGDVPEERVLRELMRLRKQGKLRRSRAVAG